MRATPLDRALADLDRSFTSIFVGEMVRRVALALVVMLVAVVGAGIGAAVGADVGAAVGLLAGAVVGVLVAVAWVRSGPARDARGRRGVPPARRGG